MDEYLKTLADALEYQRRSILWLPSELSDLEKEERIDRIKRAEWFLSQLEMEKKKETKWEPIKGGKFLIDKNQQDKIFLEVSKNGKQLEYWQERGSSVYIYLDSEEHDFYLCRLKK